MGGLVNYKCTCRQREPNAIDMWVLRKIEPVAVPIVTALIRVARYIRCKLVEDQ